MEEFYIQSAEDILNFLICKEEKKLVINLFDENLNIKENVFKMLMNLPENFKNMVQEIVFSSPYEKINKKAISKMVKLEKEFGCNSKVRVNHIYNSDTYCSKKDIEWDLKAVVKSNTEIEKVCDFIKKNDFSSFEAIAFIHDYVSTLSKYTTTPQEGSWSNADQFFVGGYLELPEIVCAGYSSLMKEIVDNLKMDGLECSMILVEFEHLKKRFVAGHARLLIKIKDDKYGLYQTFFDDPTWDNDENLTHKFAHFALPNDCHRQSKNKLYCYDEPIAGQFEKNKSKLTYSEFNNLTTFNNSKNEIDQKMIETAFFKVINAKFPNDSFDKAYKKLAKMTEASFDEQLLREFDGYITSKSTKLSFAEAKEMFGKNSKTSEKEILER